MVDINIGAQNFLAFSSTIKDITKEIKTNTIETIKVILPMDTFFFVEY